MNKPQDHFSHDDDDEATPEELRGVGYTAMLIIFLILAALCLAVIVLWYLF